MSASAGSEPVHDGDVRLRKRRALTELVNEFAAVAVSLDTSGNGPRLLVEDLESGDRIFLTPLELASLCLATDEDREDWIRVGDYRDCRASSPGHGAAWEGPRS